MTNRAAAAAACLLAATFAAVAEDAPATRSGAHYRVTCHFADEKCAEEAAAAADAAWDATLALLGPSATKPLHPPEIHLYRSADEYAAADAKVGGRSMAKDHEGFSDATSMTAHVIVKPDYDAAAWDRFGAPRNTLVLVAHEASHLAAYASFPATAYHPDWIDEGVAQIVEREVRGARGWRAPGEQDVGAAFQMSRCLLLLADGKMPTPRDVVADRLDKLDVKERYAVHWAWFDFLLAPERRDRTRKFLADACRAPIHDVSSRVAALAETAWGPGGLDEMTETFGKHVAAYAPTWRASGRCDLAAARWTLWSDNDQAAYLWRPIPAGRTEFAVSGWFEPLAGKRKTMVVFGDPAGNLVAAVFSGSYGVWLSEYHAAEKTWRDIARPADPRPVPAGVTGFEIRAADGALYVLVGGKEIVSGKPTCPLSGWWGVAVSPGASAVWQSVALR